MGRYSKTDKTRNAKYFKVDMDYIVFSDDWGRHPSSCQHLFGIFSQKNKVLWVNTVGMRTPSAKKGYDWKRSIEKICSWFLPLKKVNSNLYVFSPFMLPFQNNPLINLINNFSVIGGITVLKLLLKMKNPIVWTTIPNVNQIVNKLGATAVIYNCTDDYSLWPGSSRGLICGQEKDLLSKTDLVLASSESLKTNCLRYNKNTVLFPHGVDIDHFRNASRENIPPQIKDIPHPIAGFFGLLYEKINFNLIKKIADSYKDLSIVLIGKQSINLDFLEDYPNIHLLGQINYKQLPSFAVHFDLGLMPYVLDDEIKKSAPLKLNEYLALGIPVVSVKVDDVKRYQDLIQIAESEDDFVAKIDLALKNDNSKMKRKRQKSVENESWQARIIIYEQIMKERLNILV